MRMASVPFTVPDGAGLLAKTQVMTPAVPGIDAKQASTGALGLVILVVESEAAPRESSMSTLSWSMWTSGVAASLQW